MQELADNGSATVYRYRHEDQAGSLIGVTDEDGFRTDEYFYLDFGTPIHSICSTKYTLTGQNRRSRT